MKITENGVHKIDSKVLGMGGSSSAIYVSGDFAGATAKFVYTDEDGQVVDLLDGEILVNTQHLLEHGFGVNIGISVSGATSSTSINVIVAGKV